VSYMRGVHPVSDVSDVDSEYDCHRKLTALLFERCASVQPRVPNLIVRSAIHPQAAL
jgi:hypothetical protein